MNVQSTFVATIPSQTALGVGMIGGEAGLKTAMTRPQVGYGYRSRTQVWVSDRTFRCDHELDTYRRSPQEPAKDMEHGRSVRTEYDALHLGAAFR